MRVGWLVVLIACNSRPAPVAPAISNATPVVAPVDAAVVAPVHGAPVVVAPIDAAAPVDAASVVVAPVDGAVVAPVDATRVAGRTVIASVVLDTVGDVPIKGALVMVLREGVTTEVADFDERDARVIAWGRSNARGVFELRTAVPFPGTYTVVVVARGFAPLIGNQELRLDGQAKERFDPWGKIWLKAKP